MPGDGPTRLYASPDGRLVAYVSYEKETGSRLLVAKSASLPAFDSIADSSEAISSVAWSQSGSHLAYFTAPIAKDGQTEYGPERLRIIQPDGSDGRLVASFEANVGSYRYRTILGFDDEAMNVYWTFEVREGAGGYTGLARTDVDSGKTTMVGGDTGMVFLDGMALSPDFAKLYYVRAAGTLRERDIEKHSERTIYQVDQTRECAIETILVDATRDSLIIATTASPIVDSVCKGEPSTPQARTLRVALNDPDITVLYDAAAHNGLRAESLSPDGRFLWLGNFEVGRTTSILDLKTMKLIPYQDDDDWASRWILAWVNRSS